MGTFSGQTLTDTGTIGKDTLDPSDKFFGFGNLITSDGGKAINSTSPFQGSSAATGMKYPKIVGTDVKLVHGDRWQELEGLITEDVAKNFTTTIGGAPTNQEPSTTQTDPTTGKTTTSPGALDYPYPQFTNTSSDDNGGFPDTTDEANEIDPATILDKNGKPIIDPKTGKPEKYAGYYLNVHGDQQTKIGGDMGLWVAGYSNTVQIGQYKASFFSQYFTNTGDSQYHNTPDSYVEMNNDYKKVDQVKYRNVNQKQDIALTVATAVELLKFDLQLMHGGLTGMSIVFGLLNVHQWLMDNNKYLFASDAGTSADMKCKVNACASVDAVGSHI